MEEIYKNKKLLNELLVGKTIKEVEGDDNPENDITIVFTDGSRFSISCVGDDMSYTKLVFANPRG
jgi:hypothetical protein